MTKHDNAILAIHSWPTPDQIKWHVSRGRALQAEAVRAALVGAYQRIAHPRRRKVSGHASKHAPSAA